MYISFIMLHFTTREIESLQIQTNIHFKMVNIVWGLFHRNYCCCCCCYYSVRNWVSPIWIIWNDSSLLFISHWPKHPFIQFYLSIYLFIFNLLFICDPFFSSPLYDEFTNSVLCKNKKKKKNYTFLHRT